MKRRHMVQAAVAVVHAVAIVVCWLLWTGSESAELRWLVALNSIAAVAGFAQLFSGLYLAVPDSFSRRLRLDSMDLRPVGTAFWFAAVASAIGTVIGALTVPADYVSDAFHTGRWGMAPIGWLLPLGSWIAGCIACAVIVLPAGWVLSTVVRDSSGREHRNDFAVMSAEERLVGALLVLDVAYVLTVGVFHAIADTGFEWHWVWLYGVALAIALIGVIWERAAVRRRAARGVHTQWDEGLPPALRRDITRFLG
ncbi:hypothetical protein AB3X52_06310 [Nocardioides sp. DS6]|uniref:Uncharacterized protein n=1 Tax=Nocardioides eburneus TaxID=3231482 RepID=A0ABV3T004_9ACTN